MKLAGQVGLLKILDQASTHTLQVKGKGPFSTRMKMRAGWWRGSTAGPCLKELRGNEVNTIKISFKKREALTQGALNRFE